MGYNLLLDVSRACHKQQIIQQSWFATFLNLLSSIGLCQWDVICLNRELQQTTKSTKILKNVRGFPTAQGPHFQMWRFMKDVNTRVRLFLFPLDSLPPIPTINRRWKKSLSPGDNLAFWFARYTELEIVFTSYIVTKKLSVEVFFCLFIFCSFWWFFPSSPPLPAPLDLIPLLFVFLKCKAITQKHLSKNL